MRHVKRISGFTLIEVLIALAITATVATIAYASLSTVISGVEGTQRVAERTYEVNRAWMIISRDIRQFVNRPIRDEFGDQESAIQGGNAARFMLSFTRAGWHNPNNHARSTMQRVNYLVDEEVLWRETYPVLDRAGTTEGQRTKLLSGVDTIGLRFLDSLGAVEMNRDGNNIDTRNWKENWVADASAQGANLAPPVALEIRLQLMDWGEMRRLYEIPLE
ncbi:MAG: type II secretion system minor pseudopilin GspJ [Halieaceae bacterium]|jgi:general secretion pathway protein J|nr:type II secretion system minor pseudopilin GspJ [Halieaceae bacterium]